MSRRAAGTVTVRPGDTVVRLNETDLRAGRAYPPT
jgi:hypothetical protein